MSYRIENIQFETAQYVSDPDEPAHSVKLSLISGGHVEIPIDLGNRHYSKLMELVDEEGLIISDPDHTPIDPEA